MPRTSINGCEFGREGAACGEVVSRGVRCTNVVLGDVSLVPIAVGQLRASSSARIALSSFHSVIENENAAQAIAASQHGWVPPRNAEGSCKNHLCVVLAHADTDYPIETGSTLGLHSYRARIPQVGPIASVDPVSIG